MDNEFRKDIVSGEWVLFALDRANRPHAFKPRESNYQPPSECPFENAGEGFVAVIPNKFPLVSPSPVCGTIEDHFGFQVLKADGFHEIVVTRDHDRTFAESS